MIKANINSLKHYYVYSDGKVLNKHFKSLKGSFITKHSLIITSYLNNC